MTNKLHRLPFLALVLLATACGGDSLVASTVASTVVGTVDEAVSRHTDQECSVMNLIDGDGYCRSRTVPSGRAPVHCFRTLGGVDCYEQRDPYGLAETGQVRPRTPLASSPVPGRESKSDVAHN